MNTEIKKLTEEEVQELKFIQSENEQFIFNLGEIELAKIKLDQKLQELKDKFKTLEQKEKTLGENMFKKYGEGNINLSKGEFTPS